MTALNAAWRLALRTLSPPNHGAPLSIVIFHRVLERPDPLFEGDPDITRFNDICSWLSSWYQVLPLDEAVALLARGALPARALAITFDDGYADNYELALPVLEAHGLCATFFIATGYLNGGRMWNDTIVEAVRQTSEVELELSALGLEGVGRVDVQSMHQRRDAIPKLLSACKYLGQEQRQMVADDIAQCAQVSPRSDLMMSSEQVRALARAGMQIGAHTVNHPILSRLSDADSAYEIAASKADLQDLLGQSVTLFAYPNGRPGRDYGKREVESVRRSGFVAAVSTAYGAARHAEVHPFELPRFTPWDTAKWPFALRLVRNLGEKIKYAPE
jgi:peptidoglycan/xylan/chitin deacetylase (PgdA/CDA1 family)